ncbi:hypothetical protein [Pseudomonas linyingensis]|nr:hypothetical protein [Pseudomonas linyingensis]
MAPTLLFGAFDRHNFGDLLFPHIAAALLPGRELRFAGLAARDLRPWGGHRVEALAALAREFAGRPVNLLHVGGEMLACELFGARIERHAAQGEVAELRRAFPQVYLAVQFSADFGDDASLTAIAAQLERITQAHGLGIALFRASAAPWHDDLDCYQRMAAHLRAPTRIAATLNLWDICALLAHSRGFLGSSLHGRIVAISYALPRLNLHRAAPGKPAAYAATWEAAGLPLSVAVAEIAAGLDAALVASRRPLRELARALAARYREGFAALCAQMAP